MPKSSKITPCSQTMVVDWFMEFNPDKCNIKSTQIKDILKHAEAISNKHKI
jgi:hypothetical protein